jgi:hypothetical protein
MACGDERLRLRRWIPDPVSIGRSCSVCFAS